MVQPADSTTGPQLKQEEVRLYQPNAGRFHHHEWIECRKCKTFRRAGNTALQRLPAISVNRKQEAVLS